MSAKMRFHKERAYSLEQDNSTSEISYPQNELGPDDVTDIIDRLHIGTLRREQLKVARTVISGYENGEAQEMDDTELEEFYRNGGAHAADHRLHRQSSKASASSATSAHSSDSIPSEGTLSRQSSSNGRRISRQASVGTETQEMGIQTTIGRQSNGLSEHHRQPDDDGKKKERRASTKDKMKKLFRRKSSTSSATAEGAEDIAPLPELPQGFIVKYMGSRPTKGLWGSKHTRIAVEEIVDRIGQMPKGEDLPLVNLEVYYQGLAMRPHSKNKIKCYKAVQIPIQFISYGLQDTVYGRIFSFIMVKEMSSQSKSMECHVYACDSAKSARELAACLATAFQTYAENLDGGVFKFSVDINMSSPDEKGESCDA